MVIDGNVPTKELEIDPTEVGSVVHATEEVSNLVNDGELCWSAGANDDYPFVR